MTPVEQLLDRRPARPGRRGAHVRLVNPATGGVFRTPSPGQDRGRRARRAGRRTRVRGLGHADADPAAGACRFADLIEEHTEELALIETRDMGMAIGDARWCAGNSAAVMRYYAGAIDKFFGSTIPVDRDGIVLTFREPIGVTALITPVELPAQHRQLEDGSGARGVWYVVLKPASLSIRAALRRARARGRAAPGRAQRRPGPGRAVGDALVEHPLVGKVGFTGSTEVGVEIARKAAGTVKRVTLELGSRAPASTRISRRPGGWRRSPSSRTPGWTAAPARACSSKRP